MADIDDLRNIGGFLIDTATPDYIAGTNDADTINIYAGDNSVAALDGADLIFDVRAYGGGYSGRDFISAGMGDDVIVSSLDGAGNEYWGDDGIDTINLIPNGNGVLVDLAGGIARDRATLATSFVYMIEDAVGTAMSDYLYGTNGANTLNGYRGDDLIMGRGGSDTLLGDRGRDVLFGGTGADSISGGDDADMLYGESGGDALYGGLGRDILIGGAGRDTMYGGIEADRFKYAALRESGLTAATADKIFDFQHLTDRIDVRDIDANGLLGGDQAFVFRGQNAFTGAGQVRYVLDAAEQDVVVLFNTDNDAQAEMTIRIDTVFAMTAGDFLL
ncbi:MAG: calcium-binding protein [Hyphomicrobiaceae bacterium]